jgi:hypothetical protein
VIVRDELPEDERVELARKLLRGLPGDVDELEDDVDAAGWLPRRSTAVCTAEVPPPRAGTRLA